MKKKAAIWLLLAAVALMGAGQVQTGLLRMRTAHQPAVLEPADDMPPVIAFTTVALGGFRGFFADMLWMRAARLQREGRYFEIVQLADWITKLEPRFPAVWTYHAWNMAYNISILFDAPKERWRWVENGIQLLRNDALRYNPSSAQLYRELGWLFQHKIGSDDDSAHLYYKQRWAEKMESALSRPNELEALKLDPETMQMLDKTYGAFDWRLPQAHAVYWAWHSRSCARSGFDKAAASRMINQSILDACRAGRLVRDDSTGSFTLRPNLNLLPYAEKLFEQAANEGPDGETYREAKQQFIRSLLADEKQKE
ncbi:MAG: hypothetical protein K9M45_00050 [Kiritimatiellales bacterium]|nr:hypothetical protein [Kiritimatiellales bacterium]